MLKPHAPTVQELAEAIGELLEGAGLGAAEIDALCDGITRAFIGADPADRDAGSAATSGRDLIVDLRAIILAFAGRVLMRASDLHLERGRRYGLVGQNGVGKTTLLTRVAAGDIVGFPAGVRCVYVQHEVLAQDQESVLAFMRRGLPAGGEGAAAAALSAVGFSEALQSAAVAELSGGWRMRMAIARSMLSQARTGSTGRRRSHTHPVDRAWLASRLAYRHRFPTLTPASSACLHVRVSACPQVDILVLDEVGPLPMHHRAPP